ncbi:T9SS type A sorting domain-containing protein [Flavobacterium sp.]|uniref:T9SS type A sorting domain-containing protein n=1 Tax=Flavobacterium sp. TaxID=239 RepID=UPI00260FB547|nr:T9SS type A sorting domain-containing protein [Flavobacterium sp.]
MKKIILSISLVFAFGNNAFSQCEDPVTLPYMEDAESAALPQLPDCMYSSYLTFASSEIFQTTAGPVEGFSGNVFMYDTSINDMMPEGIGVASTLASGPITLNEGSSYRVSYKYGMSNPEGVIGIIRVMMTRSLNDYIYLPEQENVPAGTSSTFTSEPFTVEETDIYYLTIEVHLLGNQGFLYFDDIILEETPTASVQENALKNLMVYPNPVKNEINLANFTGADNAMIYTITGQLVLSQQVTENTSHINTESLSAGIYLLKVNSGTAEKTIKIIKE